MLKGAGIPKSCGLDYRTIRKHETRVVVAADQSRLAPCVANMDSIVSLIPHRSTRFLSKHLMPRSFTNATKCHHVSVQVAGNREHIQMLLTPVYISVRGVQQRTDSCMRKLHPLHVQP